MSRRVNRRRDGRYDLTLEAAEIDLIRELPDQLRTLYEGDRRRPRPASGSSRRVSRPHQGASRSRVARARVPRPARGPPRRAVACAATVATAEPARHERVLVRLQAEDVQAWLAVLNDARLALGTRIGVTDDTDLAQLEPASPEAPAVAAYAWLTHLEGELVDTLLDDLPK